MTDLNPTLRIDLEKGEIVIAETALTTSAQPKRPNNKWVFLACIFISYVADTNCTFSILNYLNVFWPPID